MGAPEREWVGQMRLRLELGGLFYRGFIDLKQVQTWVTTQKCYTEILTCNLAKCWGPSSVAKKIGPSWFCTVLMRSHLGFWQKFRAHDLWLSRRRAMAGTWAGCSSVGRGAVPPPDSSGHYQGRICVRAMGERSSSRSSWVYRDNWGVAIRAKHLNQVFILFNACLPAC